MIYIYVKKKGVTRSRGLWCKSKRVEFSSLRRGYAIGGKKSLLFKTITDRFAISKKRLRDRLINFFGATIASWATTGTVYINMICVFLYKLSFVSVCRSRWWMSSTLRIASARCRPRFSPSIWNRLTGSCPASRWVSSRYYIEHVYSQMYMFIPSSLLRLMFVR